MRRTRLHIRLDKLTVQPKPPQAMVHGSVLFGAKQPEIDADGNPIYEE